MSLNETPRSNRLHIAIFGRRNAGKSSIINAITRQEASVVSPIEGTTTDPVYKAMELLPLGPVVFIDTAGLDDEGELGELRKKKTFEVLNHTDAALIVVDASRGVTAFDRQIAEAVRGKTIPAIAVLNKIDLLTGGNGGKGDASVAFYGETSITELPTVEANMANMADKANKANKADTFIAGMHTSETSGTEENSGAEPEPPGVHAAENYTAWSFTPEAYAAKAGEELGMPAVPVSASRKQGIGALKKALIASIPNEEDKFRIVGDLLAPGDLAVLVVPIDKAAPKGRLILPQQQTIRDILESDAAAVVTKEHELKETLANLGKKPRLVITDSQVFLKAAADTPKEVPLTSFSILFARQKSDLAEMVRGARAIDRLQDGDRVLVAEACTHHQQADDIGKVKLPRWIRQATGKRLEFDFAAGMQFPDNVQDYALILHCGGCMLSRRQMLWRLEQAVQADIPIVNYGVAIAYVQGILERAISPFPLARLAWEESSGG